MGKAHGLKGAFFVSGRREKIPLDYREIWIGNPNAGPFQQTKIIESSVHQNRPILICSLARNRSAAENLVNQELWVDRAKVTLNEDIEYLWDDLIGSSVVDIDDMKVGSVKHVYNTGASDVLVIASDANPQMLIDLPLTEAFFDMAFRASKKSLKLKLSAASLEDLTYPSKGK